MKDKERGNQERGQERDRRRKEANVRCLHVPKRFQLSGDEAYVFFDILRWSARHLKIPCRLESNMVVTVSSLRSQRKRKKKREDGCNMFAPLRCSRFMRFYVFSDQSPCAFPLTALPLESSLVSRSTSSGRNPDTRLGYAINKAEVFYAPHTTGVKLLIARATPERHSGEGAIARTGLRSYCGDPEQSAASARARARRWRQGPGVIAVAPLKVSLP